MKKVRCLRDPSRCRGAVEAIQAMGRPDGHGAGGTRCAQAPRWADDHGFLQRKRHLTWSFDHDARLRGLLSQNVAPALDFLVLQNLVCLFPGLSAACGHDVRWLLEKLALHQDERHTDQNRRMHADAEQQRAAANFPPELSEPCFHDARMTMRPPGSWGGFALSPSAGPIFGLRRGR